MKRVVVALAAALALALVMGALTAPVQAEVRWTGYRMKATKVAKKMHCTKRHHATGPNRMEHSSVRCDLGPTHVTVVTFKTRKQQQRWLGALSGVEGPQAVAYARGIIVIGRDGASRAPRAAAEILACDVMVA